MWSTLQLDRNSTSYLPLWPSWYLEQYLTYTKSERSTETVSLNVTATISPSWLVDRIHLFLSLVLQYWGYRVVPPHSHLGIRSWACVLMIESVLYPLSNPPSSCLCILFYQQSMISNLPICNLFMCLNSFWKLICTSNTVLFSFFNSHLKLSLIYCMRERKNY